MITKEEARVILEFLDTSDCRGHILRGKMNAVCNKLIDIINQEEEKPAAKRKQVK